MKISIYQIYQTDIKSQPNGQIVLFYDPKGNGMATLNFEDKLVSAEMENWISPKTSNNQKWTFSPNVEGRRDSSKYPFWNNEKPNEFPTWISYLFQPEKCDSESGHTIMIPDDGGGNGGQTGGN